MKRRIILLGICTVAFMLISSCNFFKKLASKDLAEDDFRLEEVRNEKPVYKKPIHPKPSSTKKMKVALSHKDNKKLYEAIEAWYGTPYKLGGCSSSGVDCSCFTLSVYETVYDIKLNRRAMDMVKDIKLIEQNNLKEGDLVFFINGKGTINHVGIYLKEDMFAHASSSKGVTLSKLTENYWKTRFYKGGRHKKVMTKW